MIGYTNDFIKLYEELSQLYEQATNKIVSTTKKNFLSCYLDGNYEAYAILYQPGLLEICKNSFKKVLGTQIASWPCGAEVAEKYIEAWQTFLNAANAKEVLRSGEAMWADSAWHQRLKDSFSALEIERNIKTLTEWYSYSDLVSRLDTIKKGRSRSSRLQELGYSKEVSDFLTSTGNYAIRNKNTGQLYIGKAYSAGASIVKRLYDHKLPTDSPALYLALRHDVEAFEWAILDSSLVSQKNFNDEEVVYITRYNTFINLFDFNMNKGGVLERDAEQRNTDEIILRLVFGLLNYKPMRFGNPYSNIYKYAAGTNQGTRQAYDLAFVPKETLEAAGKELPVDRAWARSVLISMLDNNILDAEAHEQLLLCKEKGRSLSGQFEFDIYSNAFDEIAVASEESYSDPQTNLLLSVFAHFNNNLTISHPKICALVQTEFDHEFGAIKNLFTTRGQKPSQARQAIRDAISSLKQNPERCIPELILALKNIFGYAASKEELLQFFIKFEKRLQEDRLESTAVSRELNVLVIVYLWFTSNASSSAELCTKLTIDFVKNTEEYCRRVRTSLKNYDNENSTAYQGIRNSIRTVANAFNDRLFCDFAYDGESVTLQGTSLLNTIKFYLSLWIRHLETGDVGLLDSYLLDFKSKANNLPALTQLLNKLDELEAATKAVNN